MSRPCWPIAVAGVAAQARLAGVLGEALALLAGDGGRSVREMTRGKVILNSTRERTSMQLVTAGRHRINVDAIAYIILADPEGRLHPALPGNPRYIGACQVYLISGMQSLIFEGPDAKELLSGLGIDHTPITTLE